MFKRINAVNAAIAQKINAVVTSMWFFWFCLLVVLVVRGPLHNNKGLQELLLGYENDFQLLLIACLGFAGALQTALLFQLLGILRQALTDTKAEVDVMKDEEDGIKAEVDREYDMLGQIMADSRDLPPGTKNGC